MWDDFEIIHTYTRKQAIEDGSLVDVSKMAREAGIKWPVAVTRTVWEKYVRTDDRDRELGQSEEGRLWDILWMFRVAATSANSSQTELRFKLYHQSKGKMKLITLKAVAGPDDEGNPCITIMMPDED